MAEKQKPSRWNQFKDFLVAEQKNDKSEIEIEGLPAHAVKIVLDKKLKERLDEYEKLMELLNQTIEAKTLNEYIGELEDMVKTTHACVLRIAGVYACAGDEEEFARKMCGWDEVHSIYLGRCIKTKMRWGNNKDTVVGDRISINAVHVRNLHIGLINHFFTKAFNVLNYCFKSKDVVPSFVTVIQTMMPMMGGGETVTGSGGRVSEDYVRKPQGGPYKRELDHEV